MTTKATNGTKDGSGGGTGKPGGGRGNQNTGGCPSGGPGGGQGGGQGNGSQRLKQPTGLGRAIQEGEMKTPGQKWRDEHPRSKNECCRPYDENFTPCRFQSRAFIGATSGYLCHSYHTDECQWYCGDPSKEE